MGTEIFLAGDKFYSFGNGIEVGQVVGTDLTFLTKEQIPTSIRYPGKIVFDKDANSYWFINSNKNFVSFHDAVLIRTALENLELANKLSSEHIRYTDELSVFDKLNSLASSSISRLPRIQLSLIGETFEYTIMGLELDIFLLYINRVPYFGVNGYSNLGIMDFYYEHVSNNTEIHLAPGLNLAFNHQDILDIYYRS